MIEFVIEAYTDDAGPLAVNVPTQIEYPLSFFLWISCHWQ